MFGLTLGVMAVVFVAAPESTDQLYGDLNKQILTIHAKQNGLADIKLNRQTQNAETDVASALSGKTGFGQAGSVAQTVLIFGAGGESRTPVTSLEN